MRETHWTSFVIFREVLWNPAYTHTHTHTHLSTPDGCGQCYAHFPATCLAVARFQQNSPAFPLWWVHFQETLPSRWSVLPSFVDVLRSPGRCLLTPVLPLSLPTAISSTVQVFRKLRPNADKSPPLRPLRPPTEKSNHTGYFEIWARFQEACHL